MVLNKLGREMIGGFHIVDDIQLLSSYSTTKCDKASRNPFKVYGGCNASINPIRRVKLVDANILLAIQCAIFYSVLHSIFYA